MTDSVYIAVGRPKRGVSAAALKLCRRIGLGLIVVAKSGSLDVLADPLPYAPRKDTRRRSLLLREFSARKGDPNLGGTGRKTLMTSYRQDALRCAIHLDAAGPARVRDIKAFTGVDRAANILRDDHYHWFCKESRGVYGLTATGKAALGVHAQAVADLAKDKVAVQPKSAVRRKSPKPESRIAAD